MGEKKGFQPSQNFILNSVGSNYRKALKISTFHYDALTAGQGDPDIAAMLGVFGPKHTALVNAASAKGADIGQRIGNTATLKTLFKNLITTDLPAWQQAIKNTYAESSAAYKALFPFGNKPFSRGSIENKISTVKTLRDACNADSHPAVNAVGVTIGTFYTSLLNARSTQSGKKTVITTDVAAQKVAIKDMCTVHFADYGGLVKKFPDNPDNIEAYIDVPTLQDRVHSSLYEGTINPSQKKKICTHTFASVSTIVVTNDGDADWKLWLAESAKDKVHPAGITIPKGTTNMVIQVSTLGNTAHRVLMMESLDPMTDGSYEILVGTKNSDPLADPHD